MLRGWQAKGLALVWAYVPILLAPAVAQATIVQAGASPEETLAHLADEIIRNTHHGTFLPR